MQLRGVGRTKAVAEPHAAQPERGGFESILSQFAFFMGFIPAAEVTKLERLRDGPSPLNSWCVMSKRLGLENSRRFSAFANAHKDQRTARKSRKLSQNTEIATESIRCPSWLTRETRLGDESMRTVPFLTDVPGSVPDDASGILGIGRIVGDFRTGQAFMSRVTGGPGSKVRSGR